MLQRMRQIGRRTAELHLAFASHADIPAFAPEPITVNDSACWADALLARTRAVFDLLNRHRNELAEPAVQTAQKLFDNHDAVVRHIEAGWNTPFDGVKIRQHGDFRLGQVLIAKDDAFILGFEGGPRRPLEERRRKDAPARDIAGFIRSIDYAAAAATDRAPNLNPEQRAALAPRIHAWSERLAAAFLGSYRETLGPTALWPAEEGQTRALLDLFLLDKALSEVEHELTTRPSWAHIPIEATLRILARCGAIGS